MADGPAVTGGPPGDQVRGERTERVHGLASQIVNAATNVATSYLASLLLAPTDFGRFVIAFGAVTLLLGAGRGLLGTAALVHLPVLGHADREALVRSALGFALAVGAPATALLAVVGMWAPVLWWFTPWLVVALLQDVGRYALLATGRAGAALVLDVVWAVVQAAVVGAVLLLSGTVTVGVVATSWGLGALAGLVGFGIVARLTPAAPRRWTRATRDVAGWFTVTAVIGQVELYLALLLAGLLLAPADVGALRAVQLMGLQPALVLLGSLLTAVLPATVRAATETGGLTRAWPTINRTVLPVLGVLALVALLREPLTAVFFPQYLQHAGLVLPVTLQAAVVALGVAPLAVLNALRRGAAAFRMQLLRLVTVGVAVGLGGSLAGLEGVAWGLGAATLLTWLPLRATARRAVADHETGSARLPGPPRVVDGTPR